MVRMIDADALHGELKAKQKWVVRRGEKHNEGYLYDDVHFAIDDAPTVDAIPIDWMLNDWDSKELEDVGYQVMRRIIADWEERRKE